MDSEALLKALLAQRLMAIVRLSTVETATRAVEALAAGGVRVIEVSLAAPCALEAIAASSDLLSGHPVAIGAGTVLTPRDAAAALDAGARFLVSPGLSPEVARAAASAGVAHVPGAMTPTEVHAALDLGAPVVKLFPAAALGSGYLKDLLGPFPAARFLATGGISSANARDFIAAGAAAVAVAGGLVNERSVEDPAALSAEVGGLLAAIGVAKT